MARTKSTVAPDKAVGTKKTEAARKKRETEKVSAAKRIKVTRPASKHPEAAGKPTQGGRTAKKQPIVHDDPNRPVMSVSGVPVATETELSLTVLLNSGRVMDMSGIRSWSVQGAALIVTTDHVEESESEPGSGVVTGEGVLIIPLSRIVSARSQRVPKG